MSTSTAPAHSERLAFAIQTAIGAGETAMQWFQSDTLVAEGKSDGSPVTQADRAAERFVRDAIAEHFPGDGVIGEEYDSTESETGYTWVIDPIDGTKSFVHGVPLFGTLIACLKDGEPFIGVIRMPALNEHVAAEVGGGCWWYRPDQPAARASVSDRSSLSGAMLVSTSFEYFDSEARKSAWTALNGLGAHTRGWSDCYSFLLLATGRSDASIEPGMMNLWDIACVPPIITEAGGRWSDIEGRQDLTSRSMIASNGRIHEAVLEAMGTN